MTSCCVLQFFFSSGSAIPSVMSAHFAPIRLSLVADAGAGHDGHDLALLVLVDGLVGADKHLADAAFALFERGEVGGSRQHVAGADVVEVLDLRATVEDAV